MKVAIVPWKKGIKLTLTELSIFWLFSDEIKTDRNPTIHLLSPRLPKTDFGFRWFQFDPGLQTNLQLNINTKLMLPAAETQK